MNRQSTSTTIQKLGADPGNSHHKNHSDDLFGDDHARSGDPDFHRNRNDFDDDLYDFTNTKPSLNLDASSNNPTDDEEEDINFDYAYGYDYERVIKDRLKQVNHELNNNKDEPKRKSVLVSFDNAVTAVGIPADTDTESQGNFLDSEIFASYSRVFSLWQSRMIVILFF
jgi:hypothetical protein